MPLPVRPPLPPMLARLEPDLPRGEGWRYEPKWDGFRALVFRDGDELAIRSRDDRPLERYFPEVVAALGAALPPACALDGEIVLAGPAGLDFDALQLRLHPAPSRIRALSVSTPASYVAFDLLALGDEDLRGRPLDERRAALEQALGLTAGPVEELLDSATHVVLTPQTSAREEAARWFVELERVGLDGVVAKRAESPYTPGKRTMVKVKHRRTADCVVGGYRRSSSGDGVGSLLLGLYDDGGVLHLVGHTSSFRAAERRALLALLRPHEGEGGFGAGRAPGGPSRWTRQEAAWIPLTPALVCEVAYDHLQGSRFRHATTFLRWREDKPPRACTFDQLLPPA